jgi:hypothetical protein
MNLKQQKGLNILSGSNPNDDRRTPFIIGFYHGRDKPRNVHSFLQPMLNEFDRLCPDIDDVIPLRSCTASLRCVITDSPMRSYLIPKAIVVIGLVTGASKGEKWLKKLL